MATRNSMKTGIQNADALVPKVRSEEKSYTRDNSDETKAAKAFIKGLNILSFDSVRMAFPIAIAPLPIRKRFLEVVFSILNVWATKFDNALWDGDEELEFLTDVKRMQDALLPFYGDNR